jgi:two-component system response regulator NreC
VSASEGPITTVIADDHAIVRVGLRTVLERSDGEFRVVAEAADLASTLATVRAHRPGLLVLDLTMPGGFVLDILPELLEEQPELSISVLTMHEDPGYARAALNAGARSFVLKRAEPDEILRAFRTAATRGSYVDPRLGAKLADAESDVPLSEREREVVRHLALGYTNAQIAARLYLSERTVKTYRARAVSKLGCSTRADLTTYARTHGLLA